MKSQPTSTRRYRPNLRSLTRIAAFVALVALIGIPLFSSSIASSTSERSRAVSNPQLVNDSAYSNSTFGNFLETGKRLALPAFPQAGETIKIFASDCSTPKSAFALGETICAKTNGVDLSVPNNYYVNWNHPNNTETNGGTITQNPQYFLFSLPTSSSEAGTWKVNIGRVTPAESSIIGNPPNFTVSEEPTISTFAYNAGVCTNTPKTKFTLGETVCARTLGVAPAFNRRFAWIDPANNIRSTTPITTDPQTDSFLLPTDQLDPTYQVENRGGWRVNVITSRGSVTLTARFHVEGPTATADLSVAKSKTGGDVKSGDPVVFNVSLYNRGPSDAVNVVLTDATPANTTFVSAGQTNGSGFTCDTTVTCTGAVLKAGEIAVFEFVYTAGATGSSITNTASATSNTAEVNSGDNTATDGPYTVVAGGGGGSSTCTVACPDDIQTPANTVDQNNNSGAIVHFSAPSGNEECGNVTVDHCNDCFFPEGTTVVTATATSGETCSFNVVITPAGAGATTISCPPNKTADAGANCDAQVDPGTATATGTNVTVSGVRSDGRPLNARYPVGITTIAWTATSHDAQGEETGNASCTQTIEVTGAEDTTPPTVTAPADSSASADASCQAPIPDYAAGSTTSDNCGSTPTLTQNPEAGTLVGTGPHTVTVTATDDAGNQSSDTVVFTVNDTTAPAFTTTAADSAASADANCQAPVPDYASASAASDNCGSPTLSQSPAAGTLVGAGPHTVTVTATDGAGNQSSDTVVFTVNDTIAPTVQAPADSLASADASCQAPIPDYTAGSTASDNCGTPSLTQSPAAGTLVGTGPHTVTVTATDDAGNQSSDDVVFTVNDTTPPAITCPANVVTPTDAGSCAATVNPGTATATDNCDTTLTIVGTRSDNQPLNAPYPQGTTTITWRATDDAGNYSECQQTVTVNDKEPPTISCPADINTTTDPGTCSAIVNPGTATATDNCDSNPTIVGTRSDNQPLSAPYPKGTTTITWTATDHATPTANSSSCTQTITVVDDESPVITITGLTPVLFPANHAYHTFSVSNFVVGASDNCDALGVSNVVIQQVTSDEAENGDGDGDTSNDIVIAPDCKSVQVRAERRNSGDGRVYTITFKVTDSSGNVGTKTSTIHVPKNLGQPVVDSGPQYAVTGTCP